jgi:hypothetical protein
MRRSALVIVSILLLSPTLIAQRTSSSGSSASSGGSSSSGASHSSYSGGSSSSASSASSHNSGSSASSVSSRNSTLSANSVRSHNSGDSTSHVASSTATSRSVPTFKMLSKETANPEKHWPRTFWHPFRKATPVRTSEFRRPPRCLKQPCAVCPGGGSRHGGECGIANNVCAGGQSWNGFSCSPQYWFRDCSALARQLEAQERQMRGRNDPGQSLIYQTLRNQYEQCMARFGLSPLGSFALNDMRMEDVIP